MSARMNPFVAREQAQQFCQLVDAGFDGLLTLALMEAMQAYGFRPQCDARTAAGRAYRDAEKALLEAGAQFDRARMALKAGGQA